ncbi:MAG: hypothetical protein WCF40_10780 [Desulfobacterales bacterium]|jgi:hypothetical protein
MKPFLVVSQQLFEGIGWVGLWLQQLEKFFVHIDVGFDEPDGLIDQAAQRLAVDEGVIELQGI